MAVWFWVLVIVIGLACDLERVLTCRQFGYTLIDCVIQAQCMDGHLEKQIETHGINIQGAKINEFFIEDLLTITGCNAKTYHQCFDINEITIINCIGESGCIGLVNIVQVDPNENLDPQVPTPEPSKANLTETTNDPYTMQENHSQDDIRQESSLNPSSNHQENRLGSYQELNQEQIKNDEEVGNQIENKENFEYFGTFDNQNIDDKTIEANQHVDNLGNDEKIATETNLINENGDSQGPESNQDTQKSNQEIEIEEEIKVLKFRLKELGIIWQSLVSGFENSEDLTKLEFINKELEKIETRLAQLIIRDKPAEKIAREDEAKIDEIQLSPKNNLGELEEKKELEKKSEIGPENHPMVSKENETTGRNYNYIPFGKLNPNINIPDLENWSGPDPYTFSFKLPTRDGFYIDKDPEENEIPSENSTGNSNSGTQTLIEEIPGDEAMNKEVKMGEDLKIKSNLEEIQVDFRGNNGFAPSSLIQSYPNELSNQNETNINHQSITSGTTTASAEATLYSQINDSISTKSETEIINQSENLNQGISIENQTPETLPSLYNEATDISTSKIYEKNENLSNQSTDIPASNQQDSGIVQIFTLDYLQQANSPSISNSEPQHELEIEPRPASQTSHKLIATATSSRILETQSQSIQSEGGSQTSTPLPDIQLSKYVTLENLTNSNEIPALTSADISQTPPQIKNENFLQEAPLSASQSLENQAELNSSTSNIENIPKDQLDTKSSLTNEQAAPESTTQTFASNLNQKTSSGDFLKKDSTPQDCYLDCQKICENRSIPVKCESDCIENICNTSSSWLSTYSTVILTGILLFLVVGVIYLFMQNKNMQVLLEHGEYGIYSNISN